MRVFPLLSLFLWALLTGCQKPGDPQKVREIPLGYRGQARLNPYLAAETYLREKGWEVESSRTWSIEGDETSLIFMPASFLQTRGMALRVLEWVADGGTLVLTLQGGEPERNDFTDPSSGEVPEAGQSPGLDELFEALEIDFSEWSGPAFNEDELEEEGHLSRPWELARTKREFGGHALEFEGGVTLHAKNGSNWIPEREGGSRMVGADHGAGEVLVLAHARPLRNPYLARADHADFLEFLAAKYGEGKMLFLYGSATSFFGLLWREGSMAVIGGLLVLACWLWMRIPRFGPVLRDRAVKQKPYGESLRTSARFLWRIGELDALVRPLREQVKEKIEGSAEREDQPEERRERESLVSGTIPREPGQILKLVRKLQQHLSR